MTEQRLEVADVFRRLDASFVASLPATQRRVIKDIVECRTAALGGHLEQCEQCGYCQIAYNSCRNRHCAKCQAAARAEWLEERAAELLEVEYFHVVFTLPQQISRLALQNQRLIYGLLFRAAAETLLQIAADPQHLGAEIGFLAVLHTWGQNLSYHPHLHCVIPGGGLSADGAHWISCRSGFFLPVKVLSRLFRGKFVASLRQAFELKQVVFSSHQRQLAPAEQFAALLRELSEIEWVVYAKPSFGGPTQVLKYLASYTHRVAISNQRLVSLADGRVTFRWKDYRDGNTEKEMTLAVEEFTRRFLLHVLPRGFVRIRHYGLLANRHRHEKIAMCRELLAAETSAAAPIDGGKVHPAPPEDKTEPKRCPACSKGQLMIVEVLLPAGRGGERVRKDMPPLDSS